MLTTCDANFGGHPLSNRGNLLKSLGCLGFFFDVVLLVVRGS